MRINFDISLSKSQQEVYDLVQDKKYKYITVVFSRQSGKTVLMLVLCIQWMFQKNMSIAYICRNFVLSKRLYKELIKILPKEIIKSANGTDLSIESIYGSILNFYSAEQGASLRGQTFNYMICDEFAFHKMEQPDGTHLWNDILSPTLKARGKKCIFVSTPLGKNNIFYEMYQRGLSDEFPKYASILKTIYDDGFITNDEIEEIKKSIPELSFQQEYMCEWIDDGLSFFQGFSECFDIDKISNGKCWIGIDCSGDGTDATVCSKINEKGEIELFEAVGTLDMKYRQIADYLNRENPVAVYGEINGLGLPMLEEIKKLVRHKSKIYDWTTNNSSKEEIISDLAVSIANKDVHFLKNDMKTYNELGNFVVTVSKSRKLTFAARGSGHDDRVMATAIAHKCRKDFQNYGNNTLNFITTKRKLLY